MTMKNWILASFALLFTTQVLAADIVLFRHAEKQTGDDPELTAQGHERAKRLAVLLAPLNPTALYTTQYRRTIQTITPLANTTRLKLEYYDPRTLEELAQQLKALEGVVMVAGHSNTTPELLKILSGHDFAIDESTFDDVLLLKQTDAGFEFSRQSSN